jgi:hypothetical protein
VSQPGSSAGPSAADAQSKGRRRIPTPDLDAIEDPLERRRQQRLAKTRANAAATRCARASAYFGDTFLAAPSAHANLLSMRHVMRGMLETAQDRAKFGPPPAGKLRHDVHDACCMESQAQCACCEACCREAQA